MRVALWIGLAALALAQPVQAQDGALAEVEERGVIRVCMAEWNPFAFKDPNTNEWQGVNVEMARAFAEHLGVELETVDSTWGTFVPALQSGQCDAFFGDLFSTPEREEVVDFSDPVLFLGNSVAVHADSEAATYEDVDQAGGTVGIQSGTAHEGIARDFFEQAEVRSIVTDQAAGPLLEVANRRVDAVFIDTFTAVNFIKNNPNVPVRLLGDEQVLADSTFYAVDKGNAELLATLNEFLAEAKKDGGLYEQLIAEWVGEVPESML